MSEGALRSRSAEEAKWRTKGEAWKPIRSAPSSPSRMTSRCGRIRKISEEGNGMWRKNPMIASGIRSRTIAGTSMSW